MKSGFPITLSKSLETQRHVLEHAFEKALVRVKSFSDKYGWKEFTNDPFIKKAVILDSKADFDQEIHKLTGQALGKNVPPQFSAALENMVFVSVSPELYSNIFPDGKETDSFEKLISHEVVHRLHVRILHGNEDAMGPVWFYEGFAIFGARQFESNTPDLSEKETWSIVRATERGSYKKYAAIMRYFLRKTTLQQMVKQAAQPRFLDWLIALK